MRPVRPRHGHRQRGVAIVEFAITLPLLLVLMLATAEIGRLLVQYETLAKAVRDGARYAASKASGGTTGVVNITAQLQSDVANLVVYGQVAGGTQALLPGLTLGNVSVSNAGNGYVAVACNYTYTPMLGGSLPLLPLLGSGSGASITAPLNATVVMRAL